METFTFCSFIQSSSQKVRQTENPIFHPDKTVCIFVECPENWNDIELHILIQIPIIAVLEFKKTPLPLSISISSVILNFVRNISLKVVLSILSLGLTSSENIVSKFKTSCLETVDQQHDVRTT